VASIEKLFQQISDFSFNPIAIDKQTKPKESEIVPSLSEAWANFAEWKQWTDKQAKANQRVFDNLLFFLGDIPVDKVTKPSIRKALISISGLPQRNKKNYKMVPIEQLVQLDIPQDDVVSGKYVKEHLKLCQGLFSRYLKHELDVLIMSPTEGLKYDYQDNRYASLNDEQVRIVLSKSQNKSSWFKWFMLLSVYSGARRSELIGLNKSDFKYCSDSDRFYLQIKQGKTKAATRAIPLHKELIERGLHEWVRHLKTERLFSITPNRVTDLFNSLLDENMTHTGERIVLHSVRHTFITKARAAGISNVLVQQVVGHEKTGAGQTDRYTHTFHLKDVLPVVDSISY
jgi:integrase